jgi:hypothetical protein
MGIVDRPLSEGGAMPGGISSDTEDTPLAVSANKPLLLKLLSDSIVISYSFHLVDSDGETVIKTWSGKTTDEDDDEVVVPASSLQSGRKIVWQLLLVGSVRGDVNYSIAIEYSQDGSVLGDDPTRGTLPKRDVKSLSGVRRIEVTT